MEITRIRKGDILVYEFEGALNTNTSPDAETKINNDLTNGESKMILDLSKTSFVSSAGLRVILSTNRKLAMNDGILSVCGPNDVVRNILHISGFDTFLNIRGSIHEALTDFED